MGLFDLVLPRSLRGHFAALIRTMMSNAIGYAKHRSRPHHAVIRVYDEAGNVIETHEHAGDFKQC